MPGQNAEQSTRRKIDSLLGAAGWLVANIDRADLHAARGVALREFPLAHGFGYADYLLYVDGKACGVIEAKKLGATLTGVEVQSARYTQGLPAALPAWRRPLPFSYESTGALATTPSRRSRSESGASAGRPATRDRLYAAFAFRPGAGFGV